MVKNITHLLMNGLLLSIVDGLVSLAITSFFLTCLLTINLDALIQFEDFKYPHAYNLLNKCKLY